MVVYSEVWVAFCGVVSLRIQLKKEKLLSTLKPKCAFS